MRAAVTQRVIPPLAEALIRGLWATARVEWRGADALDGMSRSAAGDRFILAFWHCKLLLMQYALRGRRVTALISQHGDGELIARTMARFGHRAARGSSTRGGAAALREGIRVARAGGSLAITPDGPKGPARIVKPGVIELARATGLPILPASLAYAHAWRLASWDRFEVPLPFSRAVIAFGEPLTCPREAGEARRETLRRALEERLALLTADCERALSGAGAAP
jgi:lysophospholipid acyltransferase (LPLAT)-like uncharacterized protein